MTIRMTYEIEVVYEPDGRAVAFVKSDGPDEEAPLRGEGDTPLLALAALTINLREWHQGGSVRWLSTPNGRAFLEECKRHVGGDKPTTLN